MCRAWNGIERLEHRVHNDFFSIVVRWVGAGVGVWNESPLEKYILAAIWDWLRPSRYSGPNGTWRVYGSRPFEKFLTNS